MHKKLTFKIKGVSPTMLHNGRLANPLDEYAKAIKKISGKRKKTDEDYEEMARLEFHGSLYLNKEGRVCWPGENIEAAVIAGAKQFKLGPKAKAGVICDGNWPIEYSGPKDPDKLWQDPQFRDTRKCSVQRNSVMRTRPIFHDWGLTFDLHYLPDMLNESELVQIVETIGTYVGLSDFRPKFGRFQVEEWHNGEKRN